MKKVICTLILFFLFIPCIYAKDYKIENYRIDITVSEDGSLYVQEAFTMNGKYNGYERIVYFKDNYNSYLGSIVSSVEDNKIYDGSGIVLSEVRAINFDLESDLTYLKENGDLFRKENSASKGDYGLYTITKLDSGQEYKIYNSSIMNKDFYLSYIIEDIGVTHADISEIPINISEFQEDIKNLEIYVHVLNNTNLLESWLHNIKGKIEVIDVNTLKININNIEKNDSFDFRIVCDRKENYSKKTNEIVYNKILKIEQKLIEDLEKNSDEEYEKLKNLAYDAVVKTEETLNRDDYNYALKIVTSLNEDDLKTELLVKLMAIESRVLRREMLIKLFYTSLLFFWFVGLIITIYYIYKKYDKEYKVTFKAKKIDYLPSNISFASVGYLIRKRVNDDDLKASILRLIYNENIKFSKIGDNDFILRKVSLENLNESDLRIMKLLFDNKSMIKFSKLKEKVSNNYHEFITNYSNWIMKATIEAEDLEYYENILIPKIVGIVVSVIGFIMSILLIDVDTYFSSYIVCICSLLSFVYFLLLNKRTAKGDQEIVKWKALKNYLYSYNKNVNINNIEQINKYLMCSLVFGNYDRLSKQVVLRYKDTNPKIYRSLKKNLYMNDCIINAFDKLLNKAYSVKNIDFFE